jgi:serine/threonine protein kinase
MSEKRYCIFCGRELNSDDPNALYCLQCKHLVVGATPTPKPHTPRKTTPEPHSGQELKPGQTILGTYEVISLLGKGGMGKVYRVHHTGWNMDLAVKQPKRKVFQNQKGKENFVREAETWVNLGLHPHIMIFIRAVRTKYSSISLILRSNLPGD